MRLSKTVNWMDNTRSTSNQHLNPRFLIEWSEALMKDWKKVSPVMEIASWDSLIKMRATNPNILMRPKQWDTKIEEMMSKSPGRFCVNIKKHEKPHYGLVENVVLHKATCWEEQELRMEKDLRNV